MKEQILNKLTLKPYNKLQVCPDCSETKDIIYIEVQGVYDGALYIECRHCGTCFHRFPPGHYIREKADQWLEELNR
jgi:formate dehydrogenase maturation protein FdhE